ncbi:ABC transporter permease [Demequina soli]|uniref:ABC transporter permease n=1 Tax=Demequina soli TaxID=1638987 RepID=UPI000781F6C6|nr:ABC transporter permease [Demequina soli]
MSAAISAEWRKILSTRLWWALLAMMAAAVAFFAAVFAFAMTQGDAGTGLDGQPLAIEGTQLALTVYTAGVSLAYVFPLAFGAIIVTSEFRHRTIATTLLAEPRRSRVIAAKLVAAVPFALLYGLVAAAVAVGVGAPALAIAGGETMLGDPEVWRTLGLTVAAMAAWMLVGVGFGTAVTNQVAVVVGLLVWTQLVEPLLRVAAGFWSAAEPVARFLPGAAGEAVVGTSFYSASGLATLLPEWAGLAVLLGYGLVAALIGWRTTFSHDIS